LGGGAGTVSRYHAEGLAKLGHIVTVVTTWFKGEKEFAEKKNLRIIKLKSKRNYTFKSNPIEMYSWARYAVNYFKDEQNKPDFDICMAHFAIPAGIPAIMLKKKFNIPFVMISHGEDMPFVNKKRMLKFHVPLYPYIRRVCLQSVANVVLTETLLSNVNRLTGEKRLKKNFAIPNGCTEFFTPADKKFDKLRILFAGRLQDVKRPMIFLEAIQLFAKKGVDFEVNIAGDGPDLQKMKDFAQQNGLNDKINFHGWVKKEKMLNLYQQTHIQVMSSHFEAFSVAALEGLFCGAYLLSTPVSGNTDIVEEGVNGDIFPHANPQALSEKLEDFYTLKFQNQSSTPIDYTEKFRKKYNWKSIVKEYESLLEDCLP